MDGVAGRIREIAQSRVRYGYRKILVLPRREGWQVGKHLVYRLYKEEGLALKKRPTKRSKAVKHREEPFLAKGPNEAWSIDFVADQLQDGRCFRALTIVDVFTRENVAIEVGQNLRREDLVRTLNRPKHEGRTPNDSGIMKWPTSAVCFGPPLGPSELLVWTERELRTGAGVGLENQGGALRADSPGV
jgi:hypothetical protein